jgi:hypothetical protein
LLQDPLGGDDAWLNQTAQIPAVTTVEARVKREILAFCETLQALPLEVRANPLTITQMPCDQWTTFRINAQDRLIEVPVVADPGMAIGDIRCVGVDIREHATMALEAIERSGG